MKLELWFEKPPGATVDDVADFVLSALSSWGGGLHPEDPMFNSLRDRMQKMIIHGRTYQLTESKGRQHARRAKASSDSADA